MSQHQLSWIDQAYDLPLPAETSSPDSNGATNSIVLWTPCLVRPFTSATEPKVTSRFQSSVNREVTFGQSELLATVNEYTKGDCDKAKCLQQIDLMLKSGKYDANVLDEKKETVLHMICNIKLQHSVSSFEIEGLLNVLCRYNVDLNRKNILGKTALILACEIGHTIVVRALLNMTIECEVYLDMDAVDNSGETASTIAMRTGDKEVLHLMKQLRVSQRAIFLKAVENEKKELVEIVLNDALKNDEKFIKSCNAISYCNAKSWTYKPEYIVDELTWREAMQIAIGKSSKDILRLLLHYDVVVQSQDIQTGDSILHRFFNYPSNADLADLYSAGKYCSLEELPFFETVLESSLINVNTLNFNGETVLFSVLNKDHVIVRHAIELLLRNKTNVNQKNIKGNTPLLLACYRNTREYEHVSALLSCAKETDTWLDLDAKDLNGRTALMIAAMDKRHDVVELLINAGASVNLSDNRGFTALHHALHEELSPEQWIKFGEYPKNYEELEKQRKRSEILLETKDPHEYYRRTRCELNDDKMKTVNALLTHGEIDMNALDCEGFSPLDIAEALIPDIPSSIRDALIHRAAGFNVFMPQGKQSDTNAVPDVKYDCPLHRLAIRSVEGNVFPDKRYKLSPSFNSQANPTTHQRGRSPLHYAIICSRDLLSLCQVANILNMMISLGYSVNATDFWGRTPLHYAIRDSHRDYLIQIGADQTLKDRDGISAIEMSKMLESSYYSNSAYCNKGVFDREEKALKNIDFRHPNNTSSRDVDFVIHWAFDRIRQTNPLHLFEKMQSNQSTAIHIDSKVPWCIHMNPDSVFQLLQKRGKYACRHPLAEEIRRKAREFMEDLASQIKRLDQRFEVRIMPVGSSAEGTKINLPDECDFNFVLSKFSQLCEVHLSPELPTGYVRLRRKQSAIQMAEEFDFESFFKKDGILITEKVKERFRNLLTNVLTNSQFIQSQEYFDWEWHFGTKGLVNISGSADKNIKWFEFSDFKVAANFKLNRTKFYAEEKDIVESVSVDIAPCIQIDGWWPEEAITNVSADIKSIGCILVFDRPQRLYPWVPYSESCVRISFGPAESKLIRQSSEAVKEVYMMGKQLILKKFSDILSFDTSYILKTSLLYCIETSLSRADTCMKEWMELLMKCYLDFVLKDFCPCYFMPTFCIPNTEYVKFSHSKSSNNSPSLFGYYHHAYMMCRCVSLKVYENIIKLTRLNPIWGHFNREEFISELVEFPLKISPKDRVYLDCGSSNCDERCESVAFSYLEFVAKRLASPISEKPKEEYEIIYER